MTHKSHLQQLMRDIGHQLDLDEVVEFEEDNLWTLVFDGQTWVTIAYEEALEKVVLESVIGTLAEGGGDQFLSQLLQHGADRLQSGGSRVALSGPDGEALLLMELPADVDFARFQDCLTRLQSQVLQWRARFEIVGGGADTSSFQLPHGGATGAKSLA